MKLNVFLRFSFFILIFVALTRSQEFIRVGYYVSNEYTDPELQETPPGKTFVFSLGFKNFVRNKNFLIYIKSLQQIVSVHSVYPAT